MLREVFAGGPAVSREQAVEPAMLAFRAIGSPAYPTAEQEVASRAGRAYDPVGVARQAIAWVTSGDRTEQQRHLETPTLVIHGVRTAMCDVSGRRLTAARSAAPSWS